jgi:hypothetical protein
LREACTQADGLASLQGFLKHNRLRADIHSPLRYDYLSDRRLRLTGEQIEHPDGRRERLIPSVAKAWRDHSFDQ